MLITVGERTASPLIVTVGADWEQLADLFLTAEALTRGSLGRLGRSSVVPTRGTVWHAPSRCVHPVRTPSNRPLAPEHTTSTRPSTMDMKKAPIRRETSRSEP
jgi:hypothetical protein